MMPLTFTNAGETVVIKKVRGNDEARRFLGSLGFVEGGKVEIISENMGNLIVNVKGSRVAVSKEMACKIIV